MSNKMVSFLTVSGVLVVAFVVCTVFAVASTPGEPVVNQNVVCSSERDMSTPSDQYVYKMSCKPI